MSIVPDLFTVSGSVAIVTGAGRGIGRACALALNAAGADVAVCDRDPETLAETAGLLDPYEGDVIADVLDVRDAAALDQLFARVGEEFGRLDVLVNNAGGGFFAPFLDVSPKGEAALVAENFGQVAHCIRQAVPMMTRGGAIVNVTSVEAHRAGPGFAVYSAMKAAVANLTMSLALELGERGIRVNCVAPDMIPTPGDAELESASGATGERTWWPTALGGRGRPDDVAAAVLYLASDAGRFVTGTTIHVDGGTRAAGGWKRRDDGAFIL